MLAAWWVTTAEDEKEGLREHIGWADQHGCVAAALVFLKALPEDQWLHLGQCRYEWQSREAKH